MFKLGDLYATPGVLEETTTIERFEALQRHLSKDWGDVCEEDWELNDEAVEMGYRILSAYTTSKGIKFWVITEADRSATTILLPDEY